MNNRSKSVALMQNGTLMSDADCPGTLTDGKYRFFRCTWTRRFRWSLICYPDDGIGTPNHGAELTLFLAYEAAQRHKEMKR